MNPRYVLTSTCLNTGTMALTQSLRQFLHEQNSILVRDEDGETYSATVNWALGRLEGLSSYYQKRRLGVNDKIALHFEGDALSLEALTPAAKPVKTRAERVAPEPERPAAEPQPERQEKRVRVTPYPKEVMFPQVPVRAEAPSFSQELEQLGLTRESISAPWIFKASMGRRSYSVALAKFGEVEAKDLLAFRQQGKVQYAAIVAGESSRAEALAEIDGVRPSGLVQIGLGYVSPEALQRLLKLKSAFPVGALDLERLLREGRVDFESIQTLEREISGVLGERGHFSAVLTLLSELSPQQVFLLGDLMPTAREMNLEADHLQSVLESLSSAPFLLLKRISPGEFIMRQSVDQALGDWAEYAQVMNGRLEAIRSR